MLELRDRILLAEDLRDKWWTDVSLWKKKLYFNFTEFYRYITLSMEVDLIVFDYCLIKEECTTVQLFYLSTTI